MLSLNEIKLLENIFQTISNVKVEIRPIFKNGIQKTGVIFNTGNENLQPCVYVEDYQYTDFVDLAKQMLTDIANASTAPDTTDIEKLSNWEWAKHRLQLCVSPQTSEPIVKKNYLDLQEYVRVIISDKDGVASAKVTPQLLKQWGVTESELFYYAHKLCIHETRIGSMFDMLMGKEMLSLSEFSKENASEMITVVNKQKVNGAGILACKDAISDIAEKLEQDLYILPSSIHEILLVPVEIATREGLEEMSNMVREVNIQEVKPEEALSNHAYVYSRTTGEFFW